MVQKYTPSLCVDLDSLLFGCTGKLYTQVYACGVSSAKHRRVRLKSLAPLVPCCRPMMAHVTPGDTLCY